MRGAIRRKTTTPRPLDRYYRRFTPAAMVLMRRASSRARRDARKSAHDIFYI